MVEGIVFVKVITTAFLGFLNLLSRCGDHLLVCLHNHVKDFPCLRGGYNRGEVLLQVLDQLFKILYFFHGDKCLFFRIRIVVFLLRANRREG